MTGEMSGAIAGALDPFVGDDDTYLAKFDSTGTTLWVRLTGTANYDDPYSLKMDPWGSLLITGWTGTDPFGTPNGDAFVYKFSSDGILW